MKNKVDSLLNYSYVELIKHITLLLKNEFCNWCPWKTRNNLKGRKYPGVYCLAVSDANLKDKRFDWIPEIKYIGMTNSKAGLIGRLQQFDNTIIGKKGHGGADRFRYKFSDYQSLVTKLYVSIWFFECDVASHSPKDLKIMGEVAKLEYVSFAEYVKNHQKLPEFNDKKNAPKYSHKINRIK